MYRHVHSQPIPALVLYHRAILYLYVHTMYVANHIDTYAAYVHYGAFARGCIIFLYGAYVRADDVVSGFRKLTNITTNAVIYLIVEILPSIHRVSCVPGKDLPGQSPSNKSFIFTLNFYLTVFYPQLATILLLTV
jgi:hypothetical protein